MQGQAASISVNATGAAPRAQPGPAAQPGQSTSLQQLQASNEVQPVRRLYRCHACRSLFTLAACVPATSLGALAHCPPWLSEVHLAQELTHRVAKLEQLLQLKDAKIQNLLARLQPGTAL